MRQDTRKKKSVEVGEQRKELALHEQKIQREKAARRRIHDFTSGSHAQFSNHNERQTKTCEGRGQRSGGIETRRDEEVPHREMDFNSGTCTKKVYARSGSSFGFSGRALRRHRIKHI